MNRDEVHASGAHVLEGRIVHIPTFRMTPTIHWRRQKLEVYRTVLAFLLMREGDAGRRDCANAIRSAPFTEKQIELVKNFC